MGTVKSRVHRGRIALARAMGMDGPGPGTVVRPRAVGERVMTHPEELLAGYVDGTLSAQERAAVEAHVAGCARCSREIGLATSARSALRSLEEVPAPADIGSLAIREASGGRAAPAAEGTPRWYRVGGIVGAVAAGLLVFTLVLPHVGQSDDSGGDDQRALSACGTRHRGRQAVRGLGHRDPARELRQLVADRAGLFVRRPRTRPQGARRWARRPPRRRPRQERQAQIGQGTGVHRAVRPRRDGRPPSASSGHGSRGRPRTWRSSRKGPARDSRPTGPSSGSSRPTTAGSSRPPSPSCSHRRSSTARE